MSPSRGELAFMHISRDGSAAFPHAQRARGPPAHWSMKRCWWCSCGPSHSHQRWMLVYAIGCQHDECAITHRDHHHFRRIASKRLAPTLHVSSPRILRANLNARSTLSLDCARVSVTCFIIVKKGKKGNLAHLQAELSESFWMCSQGRLNANKHCRCP